MGPVELDPEMVPQFPGLGTPHHPMRKGSNTPEGKEEKEDQLVTSLSISKTYMWQSCVDYSVVYSIVLLRLKHRITQLPLREGLICAS